MDQHVFILSNSQVKVLTSIDTTIHRYPTLQVYNHKVLFFHGVFLHCFENAHNQDRKYRTVKKQAKIDE